jgi:predicted RNA binding protein YcfA (HicA-like mRNA interferase family)
MSQWRSIKARRLLSALLRLGWSIKRQTGSHKVLAQPGIGNELKRVALNPQFPYRLASVEEILALRPELRPPE